MRYMGYPFKGIIASKNAIRFMKGPQIPCNHIAEYFTLDFNEMAELTRSYVWLC